MIMFDKLKKWNWKLFFILLCGGTLAGASNANFSDIRVGAVFGLLVGIVFGIPMAYMTKKD